MQGSQVVNTKMNEIMYKIVHLEGTIHNFLPGNKITPEEKQEWSLKSAKRKYKKNVKFEYHLNKTRHVYAEYEEMQLICLNAHNLNYYT